MNVRKVLPNCNGSVMHFLNSGRGLKERQRAWATLMDGGDLQEADHSLVICVGLFKVDGGKDHY